MKSATILRSVFRPDGVFSFFLVDTMPIALTCERPWLNNQRGISCIPHGVYTCKRVNSPKFGVTFEVTNVPGRSEILIHSGNIDDDSHGCIVIGENFNIWPTGQCSIGSSKIALGEFLAAFSGQSEFQLMIKEVA